VVPELNFAWPDREWQREMWMRMVGLTFIFAEWREEIDYIATAEDGGLRTLPTRLASAATGNTQPGPSWRMRTQMGISICW
jgi:hypothetical protein